MKTTYYIVPAWSDQAGYCRIVSREGSTGDVPNNYRHHSEQWKEAGRMNSQGKLVCLDGSKAAWQEFRDCEPLAAGLVITVDNPSWEDLTAAQHECLTDFRLRCLQRGLPWKEELSHLWSTGQDDGRRDGRLLRQIRNRLGPDWLINLPEA